VRRLKNFSRKHPVTAQLSLVPTAANAGRRRITGMRARERARNSYIRNHEQPPGGTQMAEYESITTAPCRRMAVFRSRCDRLASPTHDGQPPRPAPITQTAKPVAPSPTDLSRDLPCGHGAGFVDVLGAPCIDHATAPRGLWPTSWCTCAVGRLLWPLIPFRWPQPARLYDVNAASKLLQERVG